MNADQRYAGILTRALAFAVDAVLILLLVSIITMGRPGMPIWGEPLNPFAWRHVIELVVAVAYFTLYWSSIGDGQTPGMRLVNVQLVDREANLIGYGSALVRMGGLVLAVLPLLIGLFWIAIDSQHRGWHDKLAKTWVIDNELTAASAAFSGR